MAAPGSHVLRLHFLQPPRLSISLAAPMAAPGGGHSPSSPLSTEEAFRRLLSAPGFKPAAPSIPKFIKKLDAVPEIDLLTDQPIKIALALAE